MALNGTIETGTMKINPDVSVTLSVDEEYSIPNGYHSGLSKVITKSLDAQTIGTATAEDIVYPYKGWVNGKLISGNVLEKESMVDYVSLDLSDAGILTGYFSKGYYNGVIPISNIFTTITNASAIRIPFSVLSDLGKLTPDIITKGKSYLGIDGTYTADATATAKDMKKGTIGYSNGKRIVGELESMAPYLIGYIQNGSDSVIISWTNPSVGPYAGIKIRKSTDRSVVGDLIYTGTGSNTIADGRSSLAIGGLLPKTTYYFTLSGHCGVLNESASYTFEAQTGGEKELDNYVDFEFTKTSELPLNMSISLDHNDKIRAYVLETGEEIIATGNNTTIEQTVSTGEGVIGSKIHIRIVGESITSIVYKFTNLNLDGIEIRNLKNLTKISNSISSNTQDPNIKFFHMYGEHDITNMLQMFIDCKSLTSISLPDTSNVTNMNNIFANCSSLTTIPSLDTSNVTNMYGMFQFCSSLTTIPLLNTSKVTNMSFMFRGCIKLTSIPELDTSKVTNMNNMFRDCTLLTTIPLLDTSKVTSMYAMFNECDSLSAIPLLNTSKVTNMEYMFYGCNRLTTIPLLDTSNVTDISYMFMNCTSLTTIPLLDTSKVIGMNNMFRACRLLTSIPELDTSKVISMNNIFANCSSLTTIPSLDTSNVTSMNQMFAYCSSLTTIPLLDTSNVVSMSSMFRDCTSLTTIPLLDTSKVTNMYEMFYGCTLLTSIPELDTSNVFSMNYMFYSCPSLIFCKLSSVKTDIIFEDCSNLSEESIRYILNNVQDVSSSVKQIILHADSPAWKALSDTDTDIIYAKSKGWTVAL